MKSDDEENDSLLGPFGTLGCTAIIEVPYAGIEVRCKRDPGKVPYPDRSRSLVDFMPDQSVSKTRVDGDNLPFGNQEGNVDPQGSNIEKRESRLFVSEE